MFVRNLMIFRFPTGTDFSEVESVLPYARFALQGGEIHRLFLLLEQAFHLSSAEVQRA